MLAVGWLGLTGQSEPQFDVKDLAIQNQFGSFSQEWLIGVSVLLSLMLITVLVLSFIRKRARQREREQFLREQAERSLELLMGKAYESEDVRRSMQRILQTVDPLEVLEFARSLDKYENQAHVFLQSEGESVSAQKEIFQLRKRLKLDFNNSQVPFQFTQLLAPGQTVECQIPHPDKEIKFQSVVLGLSESKLLLKPPTVNKKPANLKNFPEIHCEVYRPEDGTYRFTVPILDQLPEKKHALVTGHTRDILRVNYDTKRKSSLEEEWYME